MSRRAPFVFPMFVDVLHEVEHRKVTLFGDIETQFLAAMSEFDRLRAIGQISSGENQHKGLFFNELIVQLLQNRSGRSVGRRSKRRGVLLEVIDVDVCFPATGDELVLIAETKMMGTPQHPGNVESAKPTGRSVSRDFDKRIREVALNVIDLKLADLEGSTTRIGDISTWIQSTMPRFFGLWGMRLADDADHQGVIGRAQYLANSYANGVGLALYRAADPDSVEGRVTYVPVAPPGGMSLDDALVRMVRVIKGSS